MKLRNDCDQIVRRAIAAVQPDAAVRRALEGNPFQGGRVVLVAVGKAAWSMARAACDCVGGGWTAASSSPSTAMPRAPSAPCSSGRRGIPSPTRTPFPPRRRRWPSRTA